MKNQRGMSLVEVLVALLVLSFVTTSAVTALTLTLRQNERARLRSEATSLATGRIEQLTVMRFRSSSDAADYLMPGETLVAGPPIQIQAGYEEIPGYPQFRRTVTLNYDTPVGGMIQLVVQVYWQDLHHGEKQHQLTTFLHPNLHTGL